MKFDENYYFDIIKQIMEIDSPSGFTNDIRLKIIEEAKKHGFSLEQQNNGTLSATIKGKSDDVIAFSAHADTLGLMVRSINSDGTLSFTKIGGVNLHSVEGEYVRVHTRDGKVYTGTVCSNAYSSHVHKNVDTLPRTEENMHVILDEEVFSKEDVLKLSISVGDFICFDTKTTVTESGFIKSRFLDDKASVCIFLSYLKYINETKFVPPVTVKLLFSFYEEVGHGLSYLDDDIKELIAVDMGCIGDDLSCTEFDVSICAKDSSGPYDYDIVKKMVGICEENSISYAVDIYPMYGSDVSSALRAGQNIRGGLIGMGVRASHGMERTHIRGVTNTFNLIDNYIKSF